MKPGHWQFKTDFDLGWAIRGVLALVAVASFTGCDAKPGTNVKQAGTAAEEPAEAKTPNAAPVDGKPATGADLYAQHCAACHGAKGDGKGLAAQFLFPKPRDFRSGRFRLVSTSNGMPTFDDIRTVLRRGMPGSSMPPWPLFSDDTIRLLAEHIISLRREGIRETLTAEAAESGDEIPADDMQETVDRLTTPGKVAAALDLGDPTPEAISRGKELYATKACVQCHGPLGKGDGLQQMVDSEGLPTRPRDLTRGIFKGSPDPVSVWRRISLGMPGTPMPSSQSLSPQGDRRPDAFHPVVVERGESRCRRAYSSTRACETCAEPADLCRRFGLAASGRSSDPNGSPVVAGRRGT